MTPQEKHAKLADITKRKKINKKYLLSLGFRPIGKETNWEKRTLVYKGFVLYNTPNTRQYYYLPSRCTSVKVKYIYELEIILPMYIGKII